MLRAQWAGAAADSIFGLPSLIPQPPLPEQLILLSRSAQGMVFEAAPPAAGFFDWQHRRDVIGGLFFE
jgi:hypothetical protein